MIQYIKSSHAKHNMLCPFRLNNLAVGANCVAERCMCWVDIRHIMNETNEEESIGYCSFNKILRY